MYKATLVYRETGLGESVGQQQIKEFQGQKVGYAQPAESISQDLFRVWADDETFVILKKNLIHFHIETVESK